MKEELKKQYEWFMRLSVSHRVYVVYWLFSFLLLFGVNEHTHLSLCFLIVANFGNSVWLLRRVPIDNLKE